jgi:hypothetical protein
MTRTVLFGFALTTTTLMLATALGPAAAGHRAANSNAGAVSSRGDHSKGRPTVQADEKTKPRSNTLKKVQDIGSQIIGNMK